MFVISFLVGVLIIGYVIFYNRKRTNVTTVKNKPEEVEPLDPVVTQILEIIERNGLKLERDDALNRNVVYSINGLNNLALIKVILTASGGTQVELNGYTLNELCRMRQWDQLVSPRILNAITKTQDAQAERRKAYIRQQASKIVESFEIK